MQINETPSQGCNTSSNLVGSANKNKNLHTASEARGTQDRKGNRSIRRS